MRELGHTANARALTSDVRRLAGMADKKLRFHVVYASGEDPQYPASELNEHSSKVRRVLAARGGALRCVEPGPPPPPPLPSLPQSRGWASPRCVTVAVVALPCHCYRCACAHPPFCPLRFCTYPQELGFEFDGGAVTLTQVQLLSHQCKIAQRVELYVGFGPDYLRAEFKRLGCGCPRRLSPPSPLIPAGACAGTCRLRAMSAVTSRCASPCH